MRIVFVANRLDHGLCLSVVGPAATPPELLNHEKGDEDIADTARGRCDGGGGGSIIGPAGSSEAARALVLLRRDRHQSAQGGG